MLLRQVHNQRLSARVQNCRKYKILKKLLYGSIKDLEWDMNFEYLDQDPHLT